MTTRVPADHVRLKRAYLPADPEDGMRILVDRLWPRGVSKVRAALAFWNKDVSPSNELREWFGHDPAHWAEFCTRYRAELQTNLDAVEALRALARLGRSHSGLRRAGRSSQRSCRIAGSSVGPLIAAAILPR